MLRRVETRNFKVFGDQVFDLPEHLVVVGPNNCGKTSLLQAIAAWSEVANHWFETNPDFARHGDGTYPAAELNLLNFNAAPLPEFPHLWRNQLVNEPIRLSLETAGWDVGFEIVWSGAQLAHIRPAEEVSEESLEAVREHPPTVVYVPPVSRLPVTEPPLTEDGVRARLQSGRIFEVLRNVLVSVSHDSQKWARLQDVVREFFSYELLPPSAGMNVIAHFRHRREEKSYDLGVAASGFLQVLASYAALLYEEASVILIDEPDAHLHLLLQEKTYRKLRDFAAQTKSQLLVATHSEVIVRKAPHDHLRLLSRAGLRALGTNKNISDLLRLENEVLMLAETEPGVLYVEGESDLNNLREWAMVLGHPLFAFLDKPFWEATASHRRANYAAAHFGALRRMVPGVRGIELRDRDRQTPGSAPDGLRRLQWHQMEVENYLLHPRALERFVRKEQDEEAGERVREHMKRILPAGLFEEPPSGAAIDVLASTKGSEVLSGILQEAGLRLKKTEYCRIAAQMRPEEVHPEVRQKLDDMAAHLGISATN